MTSYLKELLFDKKQHQEGRSSVPSVMKTEKTPLIAATTNVDNKRRGVGISSGSGGAIVKDKLEKLRRRRRRRYRRGKIKIQR